MDDQEKKISRSSEKDWTEDLKTQEAIKNMKKQASGEQGKLSFIEEMGKNAKAVSEYLSERYFPGAGSWLNYMSNTPRNEMYAFVEAKLVIDIGIKVMGILMRYRWDEGFELLNEIDHEGKIISVGRVQRLISRGIVNRLDEHTKQLEKTKKIVSDFVDDLAEAIEIKGIKEYKRDYSFMLWAESTLEIQRETSSYCRDIIRLHAIKNGLCEPGESITSLSSITKPVLDISGVHEENKEHAVYKNLQKPILFPSLLYGTTPKQLIDEDTASESKESEEDEGKSLDKPRRCMDKRKAKSKRTEKTRKPFIKLRDLTPIVSTCRAWLKPKATSSIEGNERKKGSKFVSRVVHKRLEQGYEIFYKYPWKADKAEKVVIGERGFSRSC
ncbi:hypothetical protein SteCoe_39508 [Stentor coeruleus]|uniref:Uncharacterized protein n=1 Tax=Stentor coeruleus TaxID=5963 RepID=A0A1R2AKM2_9CILI|nr:hypothetical protein SteCoe_39508 [Stentor coeruleus]